MEEGESRGQTFVVSHVDQKIKQNQWSLSSQNGLVQNSTIMII